MKTQALRNYASIIGSLTNLVCALGGKTLTRSQIHPIFLLKHQSATGGEIMNQNGPRHANAFFHRQLQLKGFFSLLNNSFSDRQSHSLGDLQSCLIIISVLIVWVFM